MKTERISNRTATTMALALLLTGLTVAGGTVGCGGGGEVTTASSPSNGSAATRGSGRAVFTITWPTAPPSRLIPQSSNSIGVEVLFGGEVIARKVTARNPNQPTQQVTFDDLPIDTVTIRATAYPTTDGTGVGQATGTQELVIGEGEAAAIALTMGTSIVRLDVTPQASSVRAGRSLPLPARALDASGATVLTAPLVWSSSDETIATVSETGVVTTKVLPADSDDKTVTITARDRETGVQANTTLTVVSYKSGPAQFNPLLEGDDALIPGDLIFANRGERTYYYIDTTNATIRNDNREIIARGKLVTRTFGKERTSITYAVFTVAGDIQIPASTFVQVRGHNPLVLLARGSFSMGDWAMGSEATIDFSGSAAEGRGDLEGPGPGRSVLTRTTTTKENRMYGNIPYEVTYTNRYYTNRGGILGDGSNFADISKPQLQGGSGGAGNSASGNRMAGGGAIYIASVGPVTVASATINVAGENSVNYLGVNYLGAGGGGGGGIALWSGTSMFLVGNNFNVAGGTGTSRSTYTETSTQRIGGMRGPNVLKTADIVYDTGEAGGAGQMLLGYPRGSYPPAATDFKSGGLTLRPFDGF